MPKHYMHYDYNDFERFIREDLISQGYQVAKGAKPEITGPAKIIDFQDMVKEVVITVLVVQGNKAAAKEVASTPEHQEQPILELSKEVVASPTVPFPHSNGNGKHIQNGTGHN